MVCGDVHLIPKEGTVCATNIVVQIVPTGQPRRFDAIIEISTSDSNTNPAIAGDSSGNVYVTGDSIGLHTGRDYRHDQVAGEHRHRPCHFRSSVRRGGCLTAFRVCAL